MRLKPKKLDNDIYEYRCFKYTKQFKKMLKQRGFKFKVLIDNFLDNDVSTITYSDSTTLVHLQFIKGELEHSCLITTSSIGQR